MMSGYSIYDKDHIYSCALCRPELPSYNSEFDKFFRIIQNELDASMLSHSARMKLEKTLEDILLAIFSRNSSFERKIEYFGETESKYNSLLYDYENERRARFELESEVELLRNAKQDCLRRHRDGPRADNLNRSIEEDRSKIINLIEENIELRQKIRDLESSKSFYRRSEVDQREYEKNNSGPTDYKDLYERLKLEYSTEISKINKKNELLKSEHSAEINRLHESLKKVLAEKKNIEEEFNHIMESNKNLLKKSEQLKKDLSPKVNTQGDESDQEDSEIHSRSSESNSSNFNRFTLGKYQKQPYDQETEFKGKQSYSHLKETPSKNEGSNKNEKFKSKDNPIFQKEGVSEIPENSLNKFLKKNQDSDKKLKDLEKQLAELKEQVENNQRKNEDFIKHSSPVLKSAYSSSAKSFPKDRVESTEAKTITFSSEKKQKEKRRRSTNQLNNQASPVRRNTTPIVKNDPGSYLRRNTSPVIKAEQGACGICIRKHGEDFFRSFNS